MATLTLVDGQDSRTLVVQGRLAIQDAARLKEILLEACRGADHVIIDATQTESIDLACAQLVCSAHRTFGKAGKVIEFREPPSPGILSALAGMAIDPIGCSEELRGRCIWKKEA
ncbi:MAG: STAS domain-containing protein [Syntrophaceae bacterium]